MNLVSLQTHKQHPIKLIKSGIRNLRKNLSNNSSIRILKMGGFLSNVKCFVYQTTLKSN